MRHCCRLSVRYRCWDFSSAWFLVSENPVNNIFPVTPEDEAKWEKERQKLAEQLGISVEELDEDLLFN